MIITKEMLNQKVPKELIPSRLDSATDLYINTKKGLIVYNIKPDTWNVLYPFFSKKINLQSIIMKLKIRI